MLLLAAAVAAHGKGSSSQAHGLWPLNAIVLGDEVYHPLCEILVAFKHEGTAGERRAIAVAARGSEI